MYSVPGLILGFMINFVCRNAAIVALYYFADYGTPIDLESRTIILVITIQLNLLGTVSRNIPPDVLKHSSNVTSFGKVAQKCFESSSFKW